MTLKIDCLSLLHVTLRMVSLLKKKVRKNLSKKLHLSCRHNIGNSLFGQQKDTSPRGTLKMFETGTPTSNFDFPVPLIRLNLHDFKFEVPIIL